MMIVSAVGAVREPPLQFRAVTSPPLKKGDLGGFLQTMVTVKTHFNLLLASTTAPTMATRSSTEVTSKGSR
jgi:hypothetical protein